MWTNTCQSLAPSIRAASTSSGSRLCSPASRISIMNGVHCQISDASTADSGMSEIQSGCGALSPPIQCSRPLNRPYSGL
jgi:hypothetical protein